MVKRVFKDIHTHSLRNTKIRAYFFKKNLARAQEISSVINVFKAIYTPRFGGQNFIGVLLVQLKVVLLSIVEAVASSSGRTSETLTKTLPVITAKNLELIHRNYEQVVYATSASDNIQNPS